MAYQINKTDGSLLAIVPDSQIDENSTNLTLIGKNYSGFGELLNENLVKLLENFANTQPPDKPIIGQIWFDVSENKVKVYNGLQFVPVSSATISNSRPQSLGVGDLWYDDISKQLFFFNGEDTVLLAPAYSVGQNLSGLEVRSILDSLNQTRVITLLYTNGILLGIFSKDAFVPKIPIEGFSGSIDVGFNSGSLANIKFKVTATNSEKLGGADASTYIRADTSNTITGQLRLASDLGLVVGSASQGNIIVSNGNLLIANVEPGKQISLTVRKGLVQEDSIVIDSDNRIVNLYPNFLDSTVNVGGNLVVTGDFTVQGTTTTVNTNNLIVEDKSIELATQPNISPTDINADEGGIILRGSTPKIILWADTNKSYPNMDGGLLSQSWNFNQSINLAQNKTINIDGIAVLEQTSTSVGNKTFRLTSAVTSIPGVTSFGTQTVINVGSAPPVSELRIETDSSSNNPRISTLTANTDLELAPNGSGNISLIGNPRIIGLEDPLSEQDAATKEYVDRSLESRTIVLSIDLSDSVNPDPNAYIINKILNYLYNPGSLRENTVARILCSTTTISIPSVDLSSSVFQTTDTFNTPSGTAPAVTNVVLGTANIASPTISVFRIIREFRVIYQPPLAPYWQFIGVVEDGLGQGIDPPGSIL